MRALDGDRALVLMAGKMWVFDSREAPRGKGTFTPLCDPDPMQRLRHGTRMAVFFCVIDVRHDLRTLGR